MVEVPSRNTSGRLVFGGILVVLAIAILLVLGTWQVQRLAWKEALLAELDSRIHAAPVSLAEMEDLLAKGGDVDYRPMQVSGQFDHGKERHFLATFEGESGFYIFTPLRLADGRSLFVNRGFVPYERKLPETRAQGQVAGPVTVTGLARARLDGKPSMMVPENDPKKNVFYWKDLDAMTASTGIEPARVVPFFLDADKASNPGGLPIGGVTLIDLPNNHLQYAVTWYGLAAALAVIAVVSWRKRSRTV